MRWQLWTLLAAFLCQRSVDAIPKIQSHPDNHHEYQYVAVQIHAPVEHALDYHRVARSVESELNFEIVGQIGELDGHYLIRIPRFSSANQSASLHFQLAEIERHPRVRWAIPQTPKKLFKRSIPLENQRSKIFEKLEIKDPLAQKQWHLFNVDNRDADINVTGVWEMGITGKNVVSAIIDDGIDLYHEDLKNNFFLDGSYDFNAKTKLPENRLAEDIHGTRCAGEIAAVRNGYCGVGVAYESKVAGIRILGGPVTDVDEALALNYGYQVNHIYSCSWGPEDDGRHVEGPNALVTNAILNGIQKGRGGLGSIFVFATGNGGYYGDNCNYDGYTNSLYTISIGAITRMNRHPEYSEKCAGHLASTYSSGSGASIVTTDIRPGNCTKDHGGTSAAAPVAVGIFALVLSIRPDLSWRDLQHITVRSAIPFDSQDADWEPTAVGRKFSYSFAYGKLDAYKAIDVAKSWKNVRDQVYLEIPGNISGPLAIPHGTDGLGTSLIVTEEQVKNAHLERLEHVTVTVNITHARRGDLDIYIISPNNVRSLIGPRRSNDFSRDGFKNWTFLTVKHWEESPIGEWKLWVIDPTNPNQTGKLNSWYITLWGEADSTYKSPVIRPTNVPTPPPSPTPVIGNPTATPSPSADKPSSVDNAWKYMLGGILLLAAVTSIGIFAFRRFHHPIRLSSYEVLDESELEEVLMFSDDDESHYSRTPRKTPIPLRAVGAPRSTSPARITPLPATSGVDMSNVYSLE